MAFASITCPKCNTVGQMSLVDPNYKGIYRCWKCREFCSITLENNQVKTCAPLSEAEAQKEMQLRGMMERFKKGYK